ncbi:MAG: AraC family transcriptional regulator ligand-binding domain-containing protein [Acidobacteriota bacterium]
MSEALQGRITSLFAHKVARQVEPAELRGELLASVGLDSEASVDPSRMLSAPEYYEFLARCAAADADGRSLPLRVGASMRCTDYRTFGLAWKAAADLQGSYDRAERYGRVLTNVTTYEVEPAEEGAFLHLRRRGERSLGLRLSNEASIASLASISDEASSGDFRPRAVFFRHSVPASSLAHEEHFGCPVHFSADCDALLVSAEMLATPNRLGDPDMLRFFDTHLAAEVEQADDESQLDRKLQLEISRALSEGVPALSDIARSLGMSGRTLQRRLSERGISYQSVVDEARRRLARRMLRETDSSLLEIAFMTGFAEQSSFSRAFRRWEGQTPRSYRLRAT